MPELPRFHSGVATVRVPATSANLGPGFDTLGLALSMHDDVRARVSAGGLVIDVDGEGAEDVPRDETHLVVRAMRETFARLGGQPPGLVLDCTNRIPHGRGLGSSAAAIVAGTLLARALVDPAPADDQLTMDDAAVLELAAELEGHPDNVAACLLGSLTIAWTDPRPGDVAGCGAVAAMRVDCAPDVLPVLFIPPFAVSTHVARRALPATVPHTDAAFNAGRAALLVAALTGAPDLLLPATDDRLHQPYRATAMPVSARLVVTLRAAGVAAVISGAGPAVLALARDAAQVRRAHEARPTGWRVESLGVDQTGARIGRADAAGGA